MWSTPRVWRSELSHQEEREVADTTAAKTADSSLECGLYLFTTKTCPNCRLAVSALDRAGAQYTVLDAEEHPDLAKKLGIMQAPTLVVVENGTATLHAGAPSIRKYLETTVNA